ncbi:MAG: ATP-binding protein [Polaromonas sp.]|uniref:PAS domain-containing hybrid sensor histidine kinase/response regulator n=1 Tax=Polaromonas sp. TaxID=1869339 RepID=UPI002736EC35|nr:ATP-binding protein [Polaromonas sp.]MDP2817606.1 ATP-binding protein [Polaromonas sp.]
MKADPTSALAHPPPDLPGLCLAITEHAPLPMATVEGASHIVRYVNPAFCRLMDKSQEQLLGKPFAEMMPEDADCLSMLGRVFSTGTPETHIQQRDLKPQPVFWSCTMWPVLSGVDPVGVVILVTQTAQFHGQTVAMNEALMLGSLRQHELTQASDTLNAQLRVEITERKQAEYALRESEERYRNLFNSIDEGFCVIEMIFDEHEKPVDYRFLEVNPSFEKQSGMLEATGKRMREIAPDHEAHWFEIYGKVALTGDPIRYVNEAKALDGRWFDVYAFRIGGPESRKVALIFNNITERKQSERKLREQAEALADLHRRKDEFLAMLSHELRNPLAPISNAVHLLRLQQNEDPLQQQARIIIERQVGQLKHLVDDLLEVSRITTGRVQLRQERIVLSGIVERAVETAQPLIVQRRHELDVSLPPEPIWLHADAARLEQVVVNLLTNAAKYTDEGGRIGLTVEREGDTAVLRVRDTGIGIAPELLPRIFDLFTQAERSLDRSEGGLGIGLCLVQRLVELHSGTVEVYSVLGQGSEFVVRLPVMLTSIPPSPSTLIEPTRPRGKYCRVLVVDDNVDAAQTVAMLLEMSGHGVRMAHDGPDALEVALAWHPDLVLLDIGLPGLNGFQVAERIRQEPTLKNIVLVALTGYGLEADRQRSRETGFDHHLVKPADFEEVEKILEAVCQGDIVRTDRA